MKQRFEVGDVVRFQNRLLIVVEIYRPETSKDQGGFHGASYPSGIILWETKNRRISSYTKDEFLSAARKVVINAKT